MDQEIAGSIPAVHPTILPRGNMLYRINLPYSCYGVIIRVEYGQTGVVDAAPIARWMIGKSLEAVSRWVRQKGGYIEDYAPAPPEPLTRNRR